MGHVSHDNRVVRQVSRNNGGTYGVDAFDNLQRRINVGHGFSTSRNDLNPLECAFGRL